MLPYNCTILWGKCVFREKQWKFRRLSCVYLKRHVFSMLNRECAYRVVKTLFEDVYYVRSMVCVLKFTIRKRDTNYVLSYPLSDFDIIPKLLYKLLPKIRFKLKHARKRVKIATHCLVQLCTRIVASPQISHNESCLRSQGICYERKISRVRLNERTL